jgi:hypothetical protein
MPVITGPYNFATPAAGSLILRDYGKEFGTTSAAMRAQADPILGLYEDIISRYTPESMTQLAGTAQQRLGADLAALQAVEQGQLSAEDVRRAQQSAREAYGARGMLFSPGAVGAEILNRQSIQDAREAEARTRYQQSIQNLAGAAQLQTGNIFQPIASLLSQTFSPTSQYANAVYDYNVNAYNAYMVAQENMAAYKEAARQGQQDQFLASFGNFLLKNGIKTTADQLAGIFKGITGLGQPAATGGTTIPPGNITPTVRRPNP